MKRIIAFKVYKGYLNAEVFGGFLVELINLLVKENISIKDSILFMDRAKIHTADIL
jgi:hypothetical protein